MERLVHLPFVHTFSTSCSCSTSRSSISRPFSATAIRHPPSPRQAPPKVSLSLFASLFIWPNPKPGEPSVGDRTAGLAGRQSQLRVSSKWVRELNTLLLSSGSNTYINRTPFLTALKIRRCGIVLYPRILSKLLRGLTPVLYPVRSTAALKGVRRGEGKLWVLFRLIWRY